MTVVLVSGATRGIGRAVAERCIASGDVVVGLARDGVRLDAMRVELGSAFVPVAVDLADRAARASVLERVLANTPTMPTEFVSAAGNADYRSLVGIDAATLDAHFDLHVVAAFELIRDLSSHWAEQGVRGSVVVLSSTLATRPAAFTLPYAVAKGALDAMVRSAALELAPKGIRVNAVAPGVVDTELVRAARPDDRDADSRLAELARIHPLGRLGRPAEVAETIVHVLRSDWMTGSSVVLDGGLSLT